jgi:hypothetical protein
MPSTAVRLCPETSCGAFQLRFSIIMACSALAHTPAIPWPHANPSDSRLTAGGGRLTGYPLGDWVCIRPLLSTFGTYTWQFRTSGYVVRSEKLCMSAQGRESASGRRLVWAGCSGRSDGGSSSRADVQLRPLAMGARDEREQNASGPVGAVRACISGRVVWGAVRLRTGSAWALDRPCGQRCGRRRSDAAHPDDPHSPSRNSWSNFLRFSSMTTPHRACLHGFGRGSNRCATS